MLKFVRINPETRSELFYKVLKMRYDVYCLERGFESPSDHPNGFEIDDYDDSAVHFAAIYTDSNDVAGTVRLIKNNPLGFPLEKHFGIDLGELAGCRDNVCEISRFSVPRKYRDDFSIVKGLFECVAFESRQLGVTHWCAAMAKGLPKLLERRKIYFRQIGPEIDFHGRRAPYFGEATEVGAQNDAFRFYRSGSTEGSRLVVSQ